MAVFAAAEKLVEVQESNQILARRLAAVINVLQAQVLSEEARLPDMDSMLLSLAELKQMKDILSGSLDASDAHLLFGEKNNPLIARHPLDLEEPDKEEEGDTKDEGATAAVAEPPAAARAEEAAANEESGTVLGSFFVIPAASTTTPPPVAGSKSGPVAWADDDEELGEKKQPESGGGWLGLFK